MTRFSNLIGLQWRLGTRNIAVWLLTGLSVVLAACTPRGHGDDGTATFVISTAVTGQSEVSRFVPGFAIPSARLYNFKACVENRNLRDKVRRAPFEVIGTQKETKLRTDDEGCLYWTEEIPFNQLADERYITIERAIKALGTDAGVQRIRLAINPWKISKDAEIVDLNRNRTNAEQTLSPKESVSYVQRPAEGGRSLSVSGLTIENSPIQSPDSVSRKLRVSFHPVVLVNNMYGQPVAYPLARAHLTASVRLIAINAVAGEERSTEVAGENDIPVVADGDFFRFEYTARVRNANRNSRFQLAIQLNPVGAPSDLLPYKSLYAIGDLAVFAGSQTLPAILKDRDYTQSPSVPQNLAIQTGDPQANQNGSTNGTPIRKSGSFEVGEIKVEFMGIQAENALIRKVLFRATTCITDISNGVRPAIDEQFKVLIGEGRNRRSLDMIERIGPGLEGCYAWEDSITHRYYEPELFYHVPVEISHFQSGFSEHRVLGVNPWDRFLIGLDAKIAKATIDTFNARKLTPSRLTTDSIGLETVLIPKYSVDEFLNLKMTKTVQVRVPMRVERFSSMISGRAAPPEVLRGGIWGFRAMIYLRERLFTGQEIEEFIPMEGGYQLTRSIAGDVKARIDINIADVRLHRARAMIVFEIVPINESKLEPQEIATMSLDPDHKYDDVIERDSKLVTPTFVAPIWAGEEVSNRVPFPTDLLIAGGRKAEDDARLLQGLSYDYLIERANQLNQEKLRQANLAKSLSGFLNIARLDFVTLHNENEKYPELAKQNRGFPKENTSKALLDFMNFKFPEGTLSNIFKTYHTFNNKKPVTLANLQAFVENREELTRETAGHFCLALVRQVVAPALAKPGDAFRECLNAVSWDFMPPTAVTSAGHRGKNVFAIDHTIRLLETDSGRQIPTKQPALGFTVGADSVSMRSQSFDALALSGQLSPAIFTRGKGPLFELISGTAGMGYTWSSSVSESGSLVSNQPLAMEHIELDIQAKRYESCVAIRLRMDFWENRPNLIRKAKFAGKELRDRLTRGLYICTGLENKTPITVRESFYTFVQPVHEGLRVDRGDLSNYPFLISLRGNNDLMRFLDLIRAKDAKSWFPAANVKDDFYIAGYPLKRLNEAVDQYRSHLPIQPGMFIYEPKINPIPYPDIDPYYSPGL